MIERVRKEEKLKRSALLYTRNWKIQLIFYTFRCKVCLLFCIFSQPGQAFGSSVPFPGDSF